MPRKPLLLTAMLAALAAPPVLAQARGDVIAPPPIQPDGSVITPPAAHADPGIEKARPPEQSQLPEDKDKPKRGGAPDPKKDEKGR
jgi:hypothetical protein